ncbi:MAG: peptidoglycan DD-metalloendopeptidase family protein [Oscillospiraceae bacterium]|nr:peptidoglycan DD-metalloendopeptidase family protein [Oscillospiraceae bacterium]
MKLSKKITAFILVFAVCFSMFSFYGVQEVEAATREELKKEMEEAQARLVEINKEIAKAKDEIAAAKQRAATYAERMELTKKQIDLMQRSIDIKREELRVKQQELDDKEREHDETYALFKRRLRAMYMNNNVTTLALILGSKTFSEFLVAAEMQSKISKHDTELVQKLQDEADAIELQRQEVAMELESLEGDMDTLEDKYNELASLYREANEDLSNAEAYKKATEEDYEKVLEELKKTQEEWNALMGTGMPTYVGGYFAWPVPGYSWISSPFGWRTLYGKPDFHTGIDIAGRNIYGKPIIASNTGQVVKVAYYTTGYGYHVMIDHGDNNWTVYAHMSSIAVKQGEWVAQGQVIGYVGSTGNSTGPHLHFEVRINGERKNPLDYVSYSG